MLPAASTRQAIAERLKVLRRSRGVSQEQLARLVGVTAQVVHNWERGHSGVPADEVRPLTRALGVSIAEFYGEDPTALAKRLDAIAEQLRRAIELSPERIEIHVYVRREPESQQAGKPADAERSELREFQPTRADEDLRDVLQVWDALDVDQRRVWLQAARELRDQGGE